MQSSKAFHKQSKGLAGFFFLYFFLSCSGEVKEILHCCVFGPTLEQKHLT